VIQHLGEVLRTFLVDSLRGLEGWGFYEEAILRATEAGEILCIVLRFAAAELYSLPWELVTLRSTGQHIGELSCCLIQYEWPGAKAGPVTPLVQPGHERLLFGWSAAGGQIPADAHLQALQRASARRGFNLDPKHDVLPDLSAPSLQARLAEAVDSHRPVTTLHLLSHGAQTAGGTHGLLWSPAHGNGGAEMVDGATLRRVIEPYRDHLRLVVLCACQDARRGQSKHELGSIAQALHRVGIQAVIASRLPLSARGSVRFAEAFYGSLLGESAPLQQALLAARSSLAQRVGFDWASLQLYAGVEGHVAREAPPAFFNSAPSPPAAPVVHPPGRGPLPIREQGQRRLLRAVAVPAGVVLLALMLRWLGGLVHDAREDLLGLPPSVATYPETELWRRGATALLRMLAMAVLDIWAGAGVERWGAVAAGGLAAAWLALGRSRFHRVALVASGLGTAALAGAVALYASATRLHHVAVHRGEDRSCEPESVERWTVPEQVAFEVCSWLENETETNARRRVALAGLWGWLGAACIVGLWTSARRRGRISAGFAVAAALTALFHLRQAPRAYAIATWGLVYPRVVAMDESCAGPELSRALRSPGCRVLDVSAGARQPIFLLLGEACEPGAGLGPRFLNVPMLHDQRGCAMGTVGDEPVFGAR
jgi:hypothetical protein